MLAKTVPKMRLVRGILKRAKQSLEDGLIVKFYSCFITGGTWFVSFRDEDEILAFEKRSLYSGTETHEIKDTYNQFNGLKLSTDYLNKIYNATYQEIMKGETPCQH